MSNDSLLVNRSLASLSGSSSAHHQEFFTVHIGMVYVINPVWHIPLLCIQWETPDDGQRNHPKDIEFYSKNKFEKLVHLVGFIVRIITMHGHVNVKSLAMSVEGRVVSRDWKWNNSNKRTGNTNKISCNKNFANRKVEIYIISTIWRECRPHHISVLRAGKRTIHKETW